MAGLAAAGGWLIALAWVAAGQDPVDPPQAPSEELLLYLAEFGDADDRWVDPTTLADAADEPLDERRIDEPDDDQDTDHAPPDRSR